MGRRKRQRIQRVLDKFQYILVYGRNEKGLIVITPELLIDLLNQLQEVIG